jgi:hypothetical protein
MLKRQIFPTTKQESGGWTVECLCRCRKGWRDARWGAIGSDQNSAHVGKRQVVGRQCTLCLASHEMKGISAGEGAQLTQRSRSHLRIRICNLFWKDSSSIGDLCSCRSVQKLATGEDQKAHVVPCTYSFALEVECMIKVRRRTDGRQNNSLPTSHIKRIMTTLWLWLSLFMLGTTSTQGNHMTQFEGFPCRVIVPRDWDFIFLKISGLH